MTATVSIRKTSPATLTQDVTRLVDAADFSKWHLKSPTYVKINGNYDRHYPGSNTSPWFLDALLAALRNKGFTDLTVVEGDLPYFTADQMIRRTGLIDILNRYNVPFLNYQSMERDENEIPKMLLNTQVINVPVPHGHGFAVISCAVKNLFGLLPNPRRKHHKNLPAVTLNLDRKIKPFTIVDATVGLVGPSTRRGKPIRMDLIVAGWNAVAIDVVFAKMMGYHIADIPHLRLAQQQNLLPEMTLEGDYAADNLPSFYWPLKFDTSRRLAAWLESTWVEDCILFQRVENWLERIYHSLTFLSRKKKLFSGPWMEYQHAMKK